jgi:hypothetical protein
VSWQVAAIEFQEIPSTARTVPDSFFGCFGWALLQQHWPPHEYPWFPVPVDFNSGDFAIPCGAFAASKGQPVPAISMDSRT